MTEVDYALHYNELFSREHPSAAFSANRTFETIKPFLPSDHNAQILEIGPGNGLVVSLLKERGYTNVRAIEADETLASEAVKYGLPVQHIHAGMTLQFLLENKDKFSLIFFMHVLEHVPVDQQIDFVSAAHTALVPGGYLVCEVPNGCSPVASFSRYSDWTHKCLFTLESLSFVLRSSGFSELTVTSAKGSFIIPRGFFADILVGVLRIVLTAISESIQRIHIVAHLGLAGIKTPVSAAILGIGRK